MDLWIITEDRTSAITPPRIREDEWIQWINSQFGFAWHYQMLPGCSLFTRNNPGPLCNYGEGWRPNVLFLASLNDELWSFVNHCGVKHNEWITEEFTERVMTSMEAIKYRIKEEGKVLRIFVIAFLFIYLFIYWPWVSDFELAQVLRYQSFAWVRTVVPNQARCQKGAMSAPSPKSWTKHFQVNL